MRMPGNASSSRTGYMRQCARQMSAAAATAVDLPRLMRRRELLIGAAVTAIIAALVIILGPAPGDAAVHLYRTFLVAARDLRLGQLLVRRLVSARLVQPSLLPPDDRRGESPARLRRRGRVNRPLLVDRDAGVGTRGAVAVARLRRPRGRADVHRALRVLARVHRDARDAQAPPAATGIDWRSSRRSSRSGSARSPSRSSASSSSRTQPRAAGSPPAHLVRRRPRPRGRGRGSGARRLQDESGRSTPSTGRTSSA